MLYTCRVLESLLAMVGWHHNSIHLQELIRSRWSELCQDTVSRPSGLNRGLQFCDNRLRAVLGLGRRFKLNFIMALSTHSLNQKLDPQTPGWKSEANARADSSQGWGTVLITSVF